jgi:hypothetical protein
MDFAEMEGSKNFKNSNSGSEQDHSGHRKTTSTAADTLADAGATLIRRNRPDNNNNNNNNPADAIHHGHNAVSALTGSSRPTLAGTRGRASMNVTQQHSRRGSVELLAAMEAGRVPEETSDDDESSDQGVGTHENTNVDNRQGEQRASNNFRRLKRAEYQLKANYKDFEQWLKYDQLRFRDYFKFVVFYLILPLTAAAAILFYVFENPPCGTTEECALVELAASGQTIKPTITNSTADNSEQKVSIDSLRESFDSASLSYCLLFIVRQCVTLTLAKLGEAILIEYLALRTRVCVKLFGPMVTLVVVQSKGWPMVSFLWAILDYLLLFGDGNEWPHAQHW